MYAAEGAIRGNLFAGIGKMVKHGKRKDGGINPRLFRLERFMCSVIQD